MIIKRLYCLYLCREIALRGLKSPLLRFRKMDKNHIKALIEQQLKDTDQFLVDMKFSPNRLAIFIDKPSGILLDECSALHRFLVQELETTDFLETHDIEISSPGMDTPLVVPQQYLRRIGREMKVLDQDGREIKGTLTAANDEGIELKEIVSRKENKKKIVTEVMHTLKYEAIREAKLILNFKFIK